MNSPAVLKNAVVAVLAPETGVLTDLTKNSRKAVKRLKLWELNEKQHCPVIGTCLLINDLAKFANRFFKLADPRDEFAMHVKAVSYASRRNAVSEAIQKYLERKYQTQIRSFELAKCDAEVMAAWKDHFAHGDVAGAVWAAITHKAVSPQTQQRILADLHMFSHQVGAGQAAGARRQTKLESDYAAAKAALEKQREHQTRNEAEMRQQLQHATAEIGRLRQASEETTRLQASLAAFESGAAMMDIGRKLLTLQAANEELMIGAQRGWALEKTLKVAREEALALARERDQLLAERDALERLLSAGQDDISDNKDCDGECDSCDVALEHCVLYVGGHSSLQAHYRALAERLGIRLIHHDGGLEESLSRLPEMIRGADAVMCPTDWVSHSAYYQVKRQCKRSGKPCLLFKGAGVSSFAVALARLSSGQSSLTGTTTSFA